MEQPPRGSYIDLISLLHPAKKGVYMIWEETAPEPDDCYWGTDWESEEASILGHFKGEL